MRIPGLFVAASALQLHGPQSAPTAGSLEGVPRIAVVQAQLAGEPALSFPRFRFVDTLSQGAPPSVAFDPHRLPSYVGAAANVYVVANKNAVQWNQDPALVDVSGGAESVVIQPGGVQQNRFVADNGTLAGASGATLALGYDVVFDFDLDGRLSDGDVIDGYAIEPAIWVIVDTTTPGPYAVSSVAYSGGSFLGQITYFPSAIATLGKLPLVVVSHGNGHNYQWYGHIGEHLASWG